MISNFSNHQANDWEAKIFSERTIGRQRRKREKRGKGKDKIKETKHKGPLISKDHWKEAKEEESIWIYPKQKSKKEKKREKKQRRKDLMKKQQIMTNQDNYGKKLNNGRKSPGRQQKQRWLYQLESMIGIIDDLEKEINSLYQNPCIGLRYQLCSQRPRSLLEYHRKLFLNECLHFFSENVTIFCSHEEKCTETLERIKRRFDMEELRSLVELCQRRENVKDRWLASREPFFPIPGLPYTIRRAVILEAYYDLDLHDPRLFFEDHYGGENWEIITVLRGTRDSGSTLNILRGFESSILRNIHSFLGSKKIYGESTMWGEREDESDDDFRFWYYDNDDRYSLAAKHAKHALDKAGISILSCLPVGYNREYMNGNYFKFRLQDDQELLVSRCGLFAQNGGNGLPLSEKTIEVLKSAGFCFLEGDEYRKIIPGLLQFQGGSPPCNGSVLSILFNSWWSI